MLGLDLATLSGLCKLLFDGFAVIVMIILFVINNKKRDKDYEELQKQRENDYDRLQEKYDTIVNDVVSGIAAKHLTPMESKKIAMIEKQINDTINVIQKETNASRVCLVKYHNGNKDMTGKSFLKMSMTNEVVNLGIAPMMSDFKDVFRSLLDYWCHEIEIKENCIIEDTEKIKDVDITMYQYLHVRHIESKYGVGLRDCNNNIIGFICIEFLNKDDFNLEKIKESMNKNFPKIEALISLNGGVENELQ